jgi:hypothetical protein
MAVSGSLHARIFNAAGVQVVVSITPSSFYTSLVPNSVTMARVLFIFALLVAAASAFVAPAQHAGM